MSQHQRERTAISGLPVPKHGDSSAAGRSRLNRLLVMLGGLLAGVIVSRLRRPTTSDPASALRGTFADQSLLRGGSTPPESPVAEAIQTPDGPPPDPDDSSKPESPTDLSKPSILHVLRKAAREFSTDQCTDLAAALTYYAVPGSAIRCRTGRRTRAWTATAGRHRRRTRSATAPSRQPGHREKPGQRRTGRRTRPRTTAIRRPAQLTP